MNILRGLRIQRQKAVQVIYKGIRIKEPLFINILVEDKVIIETKATEKITQFMKHKFLHI